MIGKEQGVRAPIPRYSRKYLGNPKRFLFYPVKHLLVGAKHKNAINQLEGTIPPIIGQPVQVGECEPISENVPLSISVFFEGEMWPKVLCGGKPVLPTVPNECLRPIETT